PPQPPADDHLAFPVDAMDLKHRFGDVETDSRNRLHAGSSETWTLNNTHFHGTRVPVEEPSTASDSDITDITSCVIRSPYCVPSSPSWLVATTGHILAVE